MKFWVLFLFLVGTSVSYGADQGEVEKMIEEVNSLREALVQGVPEKVDKNTFKAVCHPVGLKLKERAQGLKVLVRQASHKNRNPQNEATPLEMEVIAKFQQKDQESSFWLDREGVKHFFRKIIVKEKCLACHGNKDKRPEFVKKKYPKDKAYGFHKGDLRGIYHVEFKEKESKK